MGFHVLKRHLALQHCFFLKQVFRLIDKKECRAVCISLIISPILSFLFSWCTMCSLEGRAALYRSQEPQSTTRVWPKEEHGAHLQMFNRIDGVRSPMLAVGPPSAVREQILDMRGVCISNWQEARSPAWIFIALCEICVRAKGSVN